MRGIPHLASTAVVVLATAVTAAAQPPLKAAYEPTPHCTSLDVYGGASSAESAVGSIAGGGAGWQITPWFAIEGETFWTDRPGTETGFSASGYARWNLVRGWRAMPFAKTGVGFYRASFDAGDDTVAAFYRDRLEGGGGGVGTNPQADAMVAFDHGSSRIMPTFTLHLSFHFEEHPITSSRQ